jgi:hypothetical protein
MPGHPRIPPLKSTDDVIATGLKAVGDWLSNAWQHYKRAEIESIKNDPLVGARAREILSGKMAPYKAITLKDVQDILLQALGSTFDGAVDITKQYLGPFIKKLLDIHEREINVLHNVRPGDEETTATNLLSEAMVYGTAAHLAASLVEEIPLVKELGLPQMAAIMANLAGFHEITAGIIGPEVRQAISIPHTYSVNARTRSILPQTLEALILSSRRVLTDPELDTLLKFGGLSPDYLEQVKAGRYRPVQPRAIATAYQDVPFPTDEVRSLMEYGGIRPSDIETMLTAFEFASIKNVRQQYLGSVLTAAERGTLTQAEIDSSLTELQFSDHAKHWVNLTIATRKLEQLAELYRKSVSEAYHFGQVTDANYVSSLEAIGIAAADAQAHYAVDSIRLHGQEAAAAARELAREQAAITRAAVQAAIANFSAGNLDAITLAAALLAAGLPALVVPFAVDAQVAKQAASLRYVFGLRVGADQAVLLRERVGAIVEQVVKKEITPEQGLVFLAALNIPTANRRALIAKAAATAKIELITVP